MKRDISDEYSNFLSMQPYLDNARANNYITADNQIHIQNQIKFVYMDIYGFVKKYDLM